MFVNLNTPGKIPAVSCAPLENIPYCCYWPDTIEPRQTKKTLLAKHFDAVAGCDIAARGSLRMANFFRRALLCSIVLASVTGLADERPNIVLIVVDDVGFSDFGAYGGEIRTPSIDALAADGIQLTNFQAAPTCGPSRAMLLTGIDNHRAGLGVNAATLIRLPELRGKPGYEGFLNDDVVTFATLLRDSGYHTFMTGKWDSGRGLGRLPADRGFERSFVLVSAGASHFSDARGMFPVAPKAHYFEDESEVTDLPDDFYSSRFYTDKMLEYVDGVDDDQPFMAYLAYTAAHWPLQVPDDWRDKYKGQYDQGWQVLRESRFRKQLELGVIPRHAQMPGLNRAAGDWDHLSDDEKQIEAKRMEIYAAMIENLDYHIGRLLDELNRGNGERETIVILLSDNGSEGNAIGDLNGIDEWTRTSFDNSLANMGRVNSYVWIGPGWAQANVTPFRIYKSYTTAGGIRTPAIFASSTNRFAKAKMHDVVTIKDIAPTILELAGASQPNGSYNGKPVLPISGKSALSYLQGDTQSLHSGEPLGWELYGNRALIKDEWKAIRTFPPEGTGAWELFNVKTDPTETTNLADDFSAVLDELIADWHEYAEQNGVIIFDEDFGYGRYADTVPLVH
jgi:arylsulfatase